MPGFGNNQQGWQTPQWAAQKPRSGNKHQAWQQPQGRLMLMVTRTNDPLPKCDKIFWLTTQFGPTERVSTFSKEGKNQVVVQFRSVEDCATVIRFLNGKELDGVVLKCVHSTMPELTFHNNDSRNRMYYDWNQCIEHCMSINYQTSLCRQQAQQLFQQVQPMLAPHGPYTESSTLFPHDIIWGQHCFGGGYYYPHSPQRLHPQKTPSQRSPARVANQSQAVDYDSLHVSGLPDDEGLFGAVQLYKLISMLGNPCGARMLASYPGTAVVSFPSQEEANAVLRVFQQSGAPIELVPGKHMKVQPSRQRRTMATFLTADVQKVCTRQDSQPVPFLTHAKTHPPSRFLLFWGVRQKTADGSDAQKKVRMLVTGVRGMDGRGVKLAEGENCVVHKSASPGVCTVSVACSRTDEAITVACALNGLTMDGWEVKLRFTTDLDQLPAGTCLSERSEDVQPPPPEPAPVPAVQPPPPQVPAGQDVQPPPPPPPPGVMFQASAPMHMYAPGVNGQNFEGYPHPYQNQTFAQPSPVMQAVPPPCMYGTGQDVPLMQPTHGVSPVPVEPQVCTPPPVPGLVPPPDTCDTPGGPVSDDESMGPEEGEPERRRMAPKTPAAPSPSSSAFVLEKSHKRRTRSQTPPPRSGAFVC